MAMQVMILAILAVFLTISMTGKAVPIPENQPIPFNNQMEPLSVILLVPEFEKMDESPFYHHQEADLSHRRRSERMTRSVMDAEGSQESEDDLETAAGTNLLRPLFVYRQQMAYRERIRKTGRRAAPTF